MSSATLRTPSGSSPSSNSAEQVAAATSSFSGSGTTARVQSREHSKLHRRRGDKEHSRETASSAFSAVCPTGRYDGDHSGSGDGLLAGATRGGPDVSAITGAPPVKPLNLTAWNFRFDSSFFQSSSSCTNHYGPRSYPPSSRSCSAPSLPDPVGYSFTSEAMPETTSCPTSVSSTSASSAASSASAVPTYFSDLLASVTSGAAHGGGAHIRRPPPPSASSASSGQRESAAGGPHGSGPLRSSSPPPLVSLGSTGAATHPQYQQPPGAAELSASSREILVRRSWEASISPLKSLGMTFFMMYMSGASSGIFGILIIGYALLNSFKSLFAVSSVFRPFDSIPGMRSTILQKMVYVALCLLGLGYVLYYCNSLGLLPVNSGDYIGLIPEKRFVERSYGAVA